MKKEPANMYKLKRQLQAEIDAAFLYKQLADHYKNISLAHIFAKMAEIEENHAKAVLKKITKNHPNFRRPPPSFSARMQIKLTDYFGFDFILKHLAATELKVAQSIIQRKQEQGEPITGHENIHFDIIHNISKQKDFIIEGNMLSTFEGKHRNIGGNELRAAVLGANDGLVSNLSLVMGVAGASSGHAAIVIAGVAGLLAGSISMALGEWLSVQSSRELYQRQIEIEAEEMESSPEEEMMELALLYQAKGMSEAEALKLAQDVFLNKETALDTLVKEELGIDKEILGGSAWKAAIASFLLFSFGAIIPLFPFFFTSGIHATVFSVIAGTLGLFFMGSFITIFTGKHWLYAGVRQVIFGLVAAAITYFIGKAIGGSIGL
jgi:VIT1/CCC1 family predicted Fe2+/Mn2+ transporter/bacterioferritin (cytochrome b1)